MEYRVINHPLTPSEGGGTKTAKPFGDSAKIPPPLEGVRGWFTTKLLLCLLCAAIGNSAANGQTVTFEELSVLTGSDWKGEMQVYDYKTNKPVIYPALLFIQPEGRKTLSLVYRYPEDSENVSKTPLDLNRKGRRIGKYDIVSKMKNSKGELEIKTFGEGKIEWQKVQYFYTYRISKNFFGIKREIWFMEDDIRIIANDFEFRR